MRFYHVGRDKDNPSTTESGPVNARAERDTLHDNMTEYSLLCNWMSQIIITFHQKSRRAKNNFNKQIQMSKNTFK